MTKQRIPDAAELHERLTQWLDGCISFSELVVILALVDSAVQQHMLERAADKSDWDGRF